VPLLLLLSDSALVPLVEVGTSRLLGKGGALEVVETGTENSTASLLFFTDVLRIYKRQQQHVQSELMLCERRIAEAQTRTLQ
jgi:hypothetical protein